MDVMIPLDREARAPLAHQIYRELRRAITGNHLPGGARLPSTRDLARQLGVARFTVDEAYARLAAEGYVVGRRGSGTYVVEHPHLGEAAPAERPAPSPRRRYSAWSRRLEHATRERWSTPSDAAVIRFDTGRPALDAFPWTVWLRLLGREARAQSRHTRAYGEAAGLPALREAIAGYLARSRGLRCAAEDVIVTSGFQQSLDVIVRLLVDPGDRAITEDPVYERVREALMAAGAMTVPIPVDADGLRVDRLPASGDPPKLLYTTPSHQFPTGAVLSLQRRLELLAWAGEAGTVIVEDDYDGELRYDARPVPPLAGLARERNAPNNVVYTGSFSKVLFPAVRLGYTVLPRDMVAHYLRAREAVDRPPPTLLQATVAAMIGEGHFERHLARMRRLYARRHAILVAAIERHLGGVAVLDGATGSAGLHVLLRVRTRRDEAELLQRAAREGVRLSGASACYHDPPAEPRLLIGFAGTPTEQIEEGVVRLARAVMG